MLKRQRALLAILDHAGRDATRLELTKWSFILNKEAPTGGGPAFYQFVPYKFGPYSFCIYQEAAALTREGLIEEVDSRTWRLLPAGRSAARSLNGDVKSDVISLLRRFSTIGVNALIEYVYDRYPWFTLNSEIGSRVDRPHAAPAIYTAGYEGLLVDGFLDGLLRQGIRRVIDVRSNPVSRRYGFHKNTLARLCDYVGVEYAHFPELGIESDQRQALGGPADHAALLARYERLMLPALGTSVDAVASLMSEKPSVLLCMESDPAQCHRSRLAVAVSRVADLPVSHLEFVG
jgi:uncharacterized protein (DUF488 family)